jgi:hypothetical protein
VRIVGPSQSAAAQNNDYSARLADRESGRWGRRTEIVQPETLLVHAWSFALTQYPASALTVWLQRFSPAEAPYSFYITGDSLAGDPFPDRKLFEAVRSRRRQPHVAESFAGRIRGMTSEGQTLDIGGGEIHLPPEPAQPAPQWGAAPAAPWGAGPQAMSPWGPPPPWWQGAAPGGQMGPYGAPPWWAQMQPPPWALGAPAAVAAPPQAIAHDPVLVELWKSIQEAQAATLQSSNAAQTKVAEAQAALMTKLLDRAFASGGQGGGQGGGMKETFGVLRDALSLVNDLRGGNDKDSGALQILETKGGDKIFATGGKVNEGLTYGIAIKDGVTDLLKGLGRMRVAPPGQAGAGGGAGIGGSTLPPKTGAAAAGPKPGANGATS